MYMIVKAWSSSVLFVFLSASLGTAQVQPVPSGADAKRRAGAEQLAKATLARDKSIAPASIEVASVEAVEWQDTSLGCPAPDMMYAQRLVSGYKVMLRAAGKSYNVHVGEGNSIICDRADTPAGTTSSPVPPDVQAYRLAREALASARGVSPDRILLKRARPLAASDPRCRTPEGRKPEGGTVYLVEMTLGDETVYYAADRLAAVPCQPR